MSDIPGARRKLIEIAQELEAAGSPFGQDVRQIVEGNLFRAKPARKMPTHSRRVTPGIRDRILELADTTDLDNAQIAAQLDINPGRVSEVLNGK